MCSKKELVTKNMFLARNGVAVAALIVMAVSLVFAGGCRYNILPRKEDKKAAEAKKSEAKPPKKADE